MKRVLAFGYFGFGNLGDELLLEAVCAMLTASAHEEPSFVALARTRRERLVPMETMQHPVRLVPRHDPVALFRELMRCDIVVCAGGLFQNRTSSASALYYLGIVGMAQLLGKPVGLLGTEFALSGGVAVFGRWIMGRCALIGIRSTQEAVRAARAMPGAAVERFPDPCFFLADRLHPGDGGARQKKESGALILVLRSPGAAAFASHVNASVRLIKRLGQSDVVLVPFQRYHGRWTDEFLAHRVAAMVPGVRVCLWETPRQVMELFTPARAVIGERFHALVLAAIAGVPFVCVSDDAKLTGFAKDWGAPCRRSLDEVDAGTVAVATVPSRVDHERRELEKRLRQLAVRWAL